MAPLNLTLTNFRDFKTRLLVLWCALGNLVALPQFWPLYTGSSISARITYKVALLTRKVLTTQRPGYLSSLIRVNQPTRQLRPSTHRVLCSTAPRTAFASRAFCHAAPAVWNELPNMLNFIHSIVSLSEFKRNFKSFLFKQSFPVWSRDWSAPAILL